MRAGQWIAIARSISIAAHPFVMVIVMVATAAIRAGADRVGSVALVALFTIVPLAVLMIRQVRYGAWENVDASNRRERPVLYLVAAATLMLLLAFLVLRRPESFMLRGVATTLALLAVCALATVWIKVSLHMAFAALAATGLGLAGSVVGYLLILVLPMLAWARLVLTRHTRLEVAAGTGIGIAVGAASHFL